MTDSQRRARLPRSYQPGRLLRLLQSDLPHHRMERDDRGRVRFVSEKGNEPVLEFSERVDRRFLGHNEIACFAARFEGRGGSPARIELRHTGRIGRTGLAVNVVQGGSEAEGVGRDLVAAPSFAEPMMPLDFTRFELERSGEGWVARVELMGATYVSLALPPMRSYIRLYPDQREALIAALIALSRLLGKAS